MNPATAKCTFIITLLAVSLPSVANGACGGNGRVARPTTHFPAHGTNYRQYRPMPAPPTHAIRPQMVAAPPIQPVPPIQPAARSERVFVTKSVAASAAATPHKQLRRRDSPPKVRQREVEKMSPGDSSTLSTLASLIEEAPDSPSDLTSVRLTASQSESHVGTWETTLPNQTRILLTLKPAGDFSWRVLNQDRVLTFDGRYQLRKERLSLVREGDEQEIAGRFLQTDRGFDFVLDDEAQRLRFERR